MREFLAKSAIVILILLSSACAVQRQYIDYKHEIITQNIEPTNKKNHHTESSIAKKHNPSTTAIPAENKVLNHNIDSGTNSTGPR